MKLTHRIVIAILFTTFSFSTTIHVATTGSDDTGDGSENNPYATIQKGLNTAVPYDTVLVMSGTYVENLVWPDTDAITLLGQGDTSNTIIQGTNDEYANGSVIYIRPSTSGLITGETRICYFKIMNGYGTNHWFDYTDVGGGIYIENASPTLEHLLITENFGGGGGLYISNSETNIFDSSIKNNTASEYMTKASAIYVQDSRLSIFNSEIIDNLSTGETQDSKAIHIYNCAEVLFHNVLVSNNQTTVGSGGGISIIDAIINFSNVEVSFNISESGGSSGIEISSWGGDSDTFNNVYVHNNGTYGIKFENISSALENIIVHSHDSNLYQGSGVNQDIIVNRITSINGNIDLNLSSSSYFFTNSIIDDMHLTNTENPNYTFNYCLLINEWDGEGEGNINGDPLFCDTDNGNYSLAENSPAVGSGENGTNMGALGIGCDAIDLSLSDASQVPMLYTLYQNYPNPFNPVTTLRYDLLEDGFVNITIYDMLGNIINQLVNEVQNSGYKSIQWNATNNQGQPVSAGVYLYSIEAGEFRANKKMVLLK